MGVDDLRFKPGVRTTLNSNTNKSNRSAGKVGEGGAPAVKKSAGSTAADNLSGKPLSSADWQSQKGSVFHSGSSRNVSARGNSNAGASGYRGDAGGTTPQRSDNYVSSGYWQKMVDQNAMRKQVYTGTTDFGYSRDVGYNGGTRRSGMRSYQRNEDYYRYVQEQLNPPIKKTFWQKMGDVISGISAGVSVVSSLVDLGTSIAGLFSKGKTKSESSNNSGSTDNTASTSSAPSVAEMENAQTSEELDTAISDAKDESQQIDQNINKSKANKSEHKAKSSGLKSAANKERKEAKDAGKEVKEHRDNAAKFDRQASAAKKAMKGKQAQIDSNNQTINNNTQEITQNNSKISDLNSQLRDLKEPASDASPAEKAEYQRQKADLEKQISKLEDKNEKLDAQNKDLNNQNKKLEQERDAKKEQMEKAQASSSEETKKANEAEVKAKKEQEEADAAQKAYIDNEAAIDAADEKITELETQKDELDVSIQEQEERYKTLNKKEIKDGNN